MPNTISITIPSVPVNEPTTSYDVDVDITANEGQDYANVALGSIQNDGNVDRVLEISVTNVVGATLQNIGIKDQNGDMQYSSNPTFSQLVPAGASSEVLIIFDVVPGEPGEPAANATATFEDTWLEP